MSGLVDSSSQSVRPQARDAAWHAPQESMLHATRMHALHTHTHTHAFIQPASQSCNGNQSRHPRPQAAPFHCTACVTQQTCLSLLSPTSCCLSVARFLAMPTLPVLVSIGNRLRRHDAIDKYLPSPLSPPLPPPPSQRPFLCGSTNQHTPVPPSHPTPSHPLP